MRLGEKTRPYTLFACLTADCVVATFYKQNTCPLCGTPGRILRTNDFERGAPLRPGEGQAHVTQ